MHSRTSMFSTIQRVKSHSSRLPSIPVGAFLLAFSFRLVALLPPLVAINPYNEGDATSFGAAAIAAANVIASGQVPPLGGGDIEYDLWGLFLSPFYLLPGPHWVYGHVTLAVMGALTVFFTAAIVRKWAPPWTAALAAFPLAVYPSVVFVQTSYIRDVGVLFGLTAGAWLVIASNRPTLQRVVLGTFAFGFAAVLRFEVALLLIPPVAVGLVAWLGTRYQRGAETGIVASVIGGGMVLGIVMLSGRIVERFEHLRENRARGRTVYMADAIPQSGVELLQIAIVGVAYFYFAPFDPATVADYVAFAEGLLNVMFFLAAPFGMCHLVARYPTDGIPLVVGFVGGSLVLGAATVNAGTAVRHRQMFLWLLFAFGAVGVYTVAAWKNGDRENGGTQLSAKG
jgi:ABC-type multidrug transport system fused ATPase/permease subunit